LHLKLGGVAERMLDGDGTFPPSDIIIPPQRCVEPHQCTYGNHGVVMIKLEAETQGSPQEVISFSFSFSNLETLSTSFSVRISIYVKS
jgi:hypothetical protein